MRDYLQERLNVPVVLDNDSNVAALAEHRYGAGRGRRHMIYMATSTGIGSGLILNGELFRGSYGWAGESGHMLITPRRGDRLRMPQLRLLLCRGHLAATFRSTSVAWRRDARPAWSSVRSLTAWRCTMPAVRATRSRWRFWIRRRTTLPSVCSTFISFSM